MAGIWVLLIPPGKAFTQIAAPWLLRKVSWVKVPGARTDWKEVGRRPIISVFVRNKWRDCARDRSGSPEGVGACGDGRGLQRRARRAVPER